MLEFINKYVLGAAVPTLIFFLGGFFLIYLRLFYLKHPIKVLKSILKPNKEKGSSPFSAMTVALAGTLGVGNIVGVSSAVILGGIGSLFWMIVSAFFSMVLKYSEVVLAVKHRRYENGRPFGGAMYYIEDTVKGKRGKGLAKLFSLLIVVTSISMGGMLQSRAVGDSFYQLFGISPYIIGAILTLLVAAVIFGSFRNISSVTSIIIPFFSVVYLVMCVYVLIVCRDSLGTALRRILYDAFSFGSVGGGIFGFLISGGVRYGAMRGLLSNEAGCGTAPTAHASTNATSAEEQGIWGILEVFIDTVLLCTLTGLVIAVNIAPSSIGGYRGKEIELVFDSFSSVLGDFSSYFLAISIFFFAFSTIICWGYYGLEALKYVTINRKFPRIYKLLYIILVFIAVDNCHDLIWDISDMALGIMTLINLSILYRERKKIRAATSLIKK